jgi:RNA polymerase sigma factor (sigma-70 family)
MSKTYFSRDSHELFLRSLYLVRVWESRAHALYPPLQEYEDLASELTEQLWLAFLRFDATKGASFATFAYWRLRGAVVDIVRRACREKERVVRGLSEERLSAAPALSGLTPQNPSEHSMRNQMVKKAMDFVERELEPFSLEVLYGTIFEGISLRGLARHHRCSYSRVRMTYVETLSALRDHLEIDLEPAP